MIKRTIGKLIADTQTEVLDHWQKQLMINSKVLVNEITVKAMKRHTTELLNEFVKAIEVNTDIQSKGFAPVLDILSEMCRSMTQANISPTDISLFIFSLKDAIFLTVQKQIDNHELSDAIITVNNIINRLSLHSFNVYMTSRESINIEQQKTLLKTSVPVVKVSEGILLVPLIGMLDNSRIQYMTEIMLSNIEDAQAKITILDVFGLQIVDSFVARQFITATDAVRLMGSECIITGIRAKISQMFYQPGINLYSIVTKATLEDGLQYALAKTGRCIGIGN